MNRKSIWAFIIAVILAVLLLLLISIDITYRVTAKVLDDPLSVFNSESATSTFQDMPPDYVFRSRIGIYPSAPLPKDAPPVSAPADEEGGSSAAKLRQQNPELQQELLKFFDYESYVQNHPPVFTTIINQEARQGKTNDPIFFKVIAQDQENDPLTYYALFLPPNATFNPDT
ncbi:MAG: hypothetical protein ABH822_01460, partial [Patescibacteria group bacterium]